MSWLSLALLALVLLLGAAVVIRLLDNAAVTKGLLEGPSGELDPERIQLLVVTLGLAGWYLAQGLQLTHAPDPALSMPEIPDWVVGALAGSQGLYLAGKKVRTVT